jgi:hypothetical protein
MKRAKIAGGALATVLILLAAAGYRALHQDVHPAAAASPAITPSTAPAAAETRPAAEIHQGKKAQNWHTGSSGLGKEDDSMTREGQKEFRKSKVRIDPRSG